MNTTNQDEAIKNAFEINPSAFYEKAEVDLLKENLIKTHAERFWDFTKLYKLSKMLQNATVTHQPFKEK